MEAYQRLEAEWARFNGLDPKGMVTCSSGTAALHLALETLDLPRGSECIVPDFTMIACPRAVTMAGLIPRLIDCGNDLLLDDGETFGDGSVEPYSAFMAVHIYGRRMDMPWISSTAGECHTVIEDLAEAHGVAPHPATDVACWSFYKNKIIAGEEGGAVYFRDVQHAERARCLRSLGFTDTHDFMHVPRGHNYRLANCLAEKVLESLHNYSSNYLLRRSWEDEYNEECPSEWRMPYREAPWVYDIRIPGMQMEQQDRIVKILREKGVEARHGFKPVHMQKEYRDVKRIGGENAERASREVIYLPLTPHLVEEYDIPDIFKTVRENL